MGLQRILVVIESCLLEPYKPKMHTISRTYTPKKKVYLLNLECLSLKSVQAPNEQTQAGHGQPDTILMGFASFPVGSEVYLIFKAKPSHQ